MRFNFLGLGKPLRSRLESLACGCERPTSILDRPCLSISSAGAGWLADTARDKRTLPTMWLFARLSGLRSCVCNRGLAGKPFTKHVRLYLPRKRSGHEGAHDAVQPAWNDSGAAFKQ